MRAARVCLSRGVVMGLCSSRLLHMYPSMLATGHVGNDRSSKRRTICSRWTRSRRHPSAARGSNRRSSSETQPDSRNGRPSRLCHSQQLAGSCFPIAYSGQLARHPATQFGRRGCATGRQCISCAACSGENGRARTLNRPLTLDPLAVVSGRDVKGSWCLGSGRCETTTFLGALEHSPSTAAAARDSSRAGYANRQARRTPR